MKFLPRAVTFTAVTFCAGALANAATLQVSPDPQSLPVQVQNTQEQHVVPTPQATVPAPPPTEIVQPIPAADSDDAEFNSLSAVVAAQDAPDASSDELKCLATAIYYEAKSEPLAGQLAVAEVILNRTTSGRFPSKVCSVVTQRGQFAFVHGGQLPTPPANGQWKKALAVAQVAQKDLWDSPVPNALYFHARYSKASWNRPRVGQVGNHVFYR